MPMKSVKVINLIFGIVMKMWYCLITCDKIHDSYKYMQIINSKTTFFYFNFIYLWLKVSCLLQSSEIFGYMWISTFHTLRYCRSMNIHYLREVCQRQYSYFIMQFNFKTTYSTKLKGNIFVFIMISYFYALTISIVFLKSCYYYCISF